MKRRTFIESIVASTAVFSGCSAISGSEPETVDVFDVEFKPFGKKVTAYIENKSEDNLQDLQVKASVIDGSGEPIDSRYVRVKELPANREMTIAVQFPAVDVRIVDKGSVEVLRYETV